MQHLLEKRIRYFFASPYRGREDVHRTLKGLRDYGRLVLIGGMLRDIAMFGNASFNSDLDFVISPYDLESFEKHMTKVGARVNRFGGYALPSRKWQIDVWPLQRTWAHVEGHVKVQTVKDLHYTTFFKCDAITYDLEHKRLRTNEGYFHDLDRKILDINLRPNPNPTGNAVRAFRYALLKGFRWGPLLSQFVAETVDAVGWNELRDVEKRSFNTQFLGLLDNSELNRELVRHVLLDHNTLFEPQKFMRNVQLNLPHLT
jgi:hypothetical protein